jgi:ketosteroid isomerase-like protein
MLMVDLKADKELVEQVIQGLCEADKSKDLDQVMAFFSEDIIYQPQGVSPLFGKAAVREYLDGAFDLMEDAKAGFDRTEVAISGDLAYSAGWFKSKRYDWEDYFEYKTLFVLRKTVDGWKIIAESVSRNSREGGEYYGLNPKLEEKSS